MRTRALFLLVAICSATCAVQGQDSTRSSDTSRVHQVVIVDPGIALGKPVLLFPPFLEPELKFTDMGTPGLFLQGGYTLKPDLIPPYLLGPKKGNALSALYSVIGAVELGAVGYFAYRHIKKYGLFK